VSQILNFSKTLFTNKLCRLSLENVKTSNGLVAHLENEVQSAKSSTEQDNGDEEEIEGAEEGDADADDDDVSSIKKVLAQCSAPMFHSIGY